uniref:Uncharacterized protein n=1 Tax=Oryza glumipatula TaxID=40148 RepID=A0A0D9ZGR6_9ORYZ
MQMSPSRLGFRRCHVRACRSCGISVQASGAAASYFVSISQANCMAESYGWTKTETWYM